MELFINSSNSLVEQWYGVHTRVTSATPAWAPYHRPYGCEWILKLHSICNDNVYVICISDFCWWSLLLCLLILSTCDSAADFCTIHGTHLEYATAVGDSHLHVQELESVQHFVCRVCTTRWDYHVTCKHIPYFLKRTRKLLKMCHLYKIVYGFLKPYYIVEMGVCSSRCCS